MCCFTRPVDFVANTRIFARADGRGGQFLAYQMQYLAAEDLAMILPLPVRLPAHKDSVRFIALNRDRTFFDRLGNGFPDVTEDDVRRAGIPLYAPLVGKYLEPRLTTVIGLASAKDGAAGGVLAVRRVGDYEASFVPQLNDFERLDPRFKLPRSTWDKIPAYRDYGFAVFKLRKPDLSAPRPPSAHHDDPAEDDFNNLDAADAERLRVRPGGVTNHPHPMALLFPTRTPDALFFPTVHIHDGKVHDRETFDHTLFMQGVRPTHVSRIPERIPRWLLRDDRTRPLRQGEPLYREAPPESRSPVRDLPELVPLTLLHRRIRAGRGYYLPWSEYAGTITDDGFPTTTATKTPDDEKLRESRSPASYFTDSTAQGILARNEFCAKRELRGEFANRDVIVALR